MKKLLLLLLTYGTLFSASFYTLDNVKSLNLYVANQADFMDKKQKNEIKKNLKIRLQKAGFIFGETDSITFMLKIEAIDVDDTQVINVQIGLAEEVITSRKASIETFAFTYLANDFIESDEPYIDTVESINFLVSEFINAYRDDNEQ